MDGNRFDGMTKSFASGSSRRSILKAALGLTGGGAIANAFGASALARRRGGTTDGTNDPPACPEGMVECPNAENCCADGMCNEVGVCCPEGTSPCGDSCCSPCDGYVCGLDCCSEQVQCCGGECCPEGSSCLTQIYGEIDGVEEETCCFTANMCDSDWDRCCDDWQSCCEIDGCCDGRCCEGNCIPADACCGNEECLSGDACLIDECLDGACVYTPVDCSAFADECNEGLCDSASGCFPSPINDGGSCQSGAGTCAGGQCQLCTPDFIACSTDDECCTEQCACGDNVAAGTCRPASYFEGFEGSTGQWTGPIVSNGSNGVIDTDDNGTAFSPLGGYSTVWPTNGYVVSIDVFLDMSLATGSNDIQFDYTAASNRSDSSCVHLRDFVFNVGTNPTTANQFAINASNNVPGIPSGPGSVSVSTSGWYTFEHVFQNVGGVLSVTLNAYGPGGGLVGSWVRTTAADTIPGVVGGNRYAWFATNGFADLLVDNSQRSDI